jgi:hypothetical protein
MPAVELTILEVGEFLPALFVAAQFIPAAPCG